ncbi:MAG: rhomboid family intramembrane serine protease [Epulopiscium sp.]|nr:rhomboid family intramembrane serine protease [Candidatus Epulonipiscium sp.]
MHKLKDLYRRAKVTFIFLVIIVFYFIFIALNGGTTNTDALIKYGAMFPPYVLFYKEYYRFISSIFIHIGLMHIIFNSYALYIFGPQIEGLMGSKKYLLFFLLTGIGGNLTTFIFNFKSVSAGASGSLFGLLGAFLYLLHRRPYMITPEGRRSLLSLLGINLAITVVSPSISTTAHLGGLIIGYLLSYIFLKEKNY